MDIRQADVSSAKAERQPPMVEPKLVQDRCVQVVNRDRVFRDSVAKLIRRAVGKTFFEAPAGWTNTLRTSRWTI